ncbi:two-component regulator propeller domain-containing protein [Flavobacterium reichenbachii]|uniref:AraC family transcriptional regulator n=1 Tax=Flavobacterium reichenbachii TaxID=362418 RepID=A0A085ZM94_9FLAO|nr:two-component regulator propeller domain-containing protein [Flavobacterium reichenbachii]KFF05558.1 AraC family transcriptional regulator [Flavobacterium reichenbachii]OXB17893.1 AraC family transcriptional regulator [Flavobacterium reichenbachii]
MVTRLFIVCFITLQSFGQQIKFENFTTNQGLSNNSVIDIENDKDGGLWVATWDGLNYYDGHNFKSFKHNPNDPKSISSNYIIKLKKDNDGFIWLISKEGDINKYIGNGKFVSFKFKSIPKNILLSEKGDIIVQTTAAYYEFKNGAFVEVPYNAVKKTNLNNLKNILLREYPKLVINDVLKDKLGNIWYATQKDGIYIISANAGKNTIAHFTSDLYLPYSFNSNEIETLHEDDFGNIWLGQKDGGLSMAYAGSERINTIVPHPVKYPNLPTETIRAITKDSNGKIWLGYYTNGIYYYNENSHSYQKFRISEAASNSDWERVRNLFTASDGTIWVGTYKGIIRISGGKYTCYEAGKIEELPNNRSYSICEDENKILWIGCWGGVAKFNLAAEKFESFKGQKALSKYNVRCVKKDKQNLILATESDGVVNLNLETNAINQISKQKGILGNSIYSVLIDKATENYWIASLGGVSIYNKKKGLVKNITEADGLPSHMVYGLIDNGDKVWISTTKGIASIAKNNFKITTFNPDHGWQATEFSEGAYYQDTKGILFFGGINGLNYFNPNNIQAIQCSGKIKLAVDGKENYLPVIEKSFTDNELEIEIIPIVFPKNNNSDIYYKLEGRDKNWILLKDTQKIEYSNLSSGDYNFLIKQGENGLAKPVFFTLHISKAFYETILFYILFSVLILIGCMLLIYFKNKSAAAKQDYLEEKIRNRTAVIENQKKDLEAINKELDEKNKKIIEQKEKLLELHSNLKNENFEIEKFKAFMLAEFQDPIAKIIKISSAHKKDNEVQRDLLLESGKLANLISSWNYLSYVKDIGSLKKSAVNLFPILKNSIEKLKKDLQRNQVNLNCEIDNAVNFVAIDVLRLKLLLQYFFNDISKYSEVESTLNIEIGYENDYLVVTVVSDSVILKNNWYNILHYSPYFKALQVLLEDLNGEFSDSSEDEFKSTLRIPLEFASENLKIKETISWKHFNSQELSSDKELFLVFSDQSDYTAANQVLENSNHHLLFENSVANLNSAIKQLNFSALVFYQATFSKELVHFLESNKKMLGLKMPMIYISEDINYELHEQLLELGIDTLIQLPASASFISKKIASLIDKNRETQQENAMQQKIFEILTEDDPLITNNDKLVKQALEIIKKELQDPSFNVETLVENLEISRVKCYRIFKETLNQSPSDVITSLRLQKAEILLKTKKLNISEISFECGYNDPKYFGRSFKKYFGKSPKEYKAFS